MEPTVEILIKSSRRPWALDRLLESLAQNLVRRDNIRTFVVDDRTPKHYLDKLTDKHSEVIIWESSRRSKLGNPGADAPYVENWRLFGSESEAKYLFVLEEDQWLTQELDLVELAKFMDEKKFLVTQLSMASQEIVGAQVNATSSILWDSFIPKGFASFQDSGLLNLLVRSWASFVCSPSAVNRKIFGGLSVLLPSLPRSHWVPLAMANPIAGALFNRQYWLSLWRPGQTKINENLQITRALKEISGVAKGKTFFASGNQRYFETSYVSSISLDLGLELDWPHLNSIWSERWLRGEFPNPAANADWDATVLAQMLSESNIDPSSYLEWVRRFRLLHQRD